MNAITCEHIDVGAYALGLLEDQDKATFEAHLARCSSCAAELAALSPVAALLDGVRTTYGRRHLRWQAAVGVAALVAALGGGITARVAAAPRQAPPAATAAGLTGQLHSATNPATGVAGTVGLTDMAWGTAVSLDLAHVRGPFTCELIAVSKTGEREVVSGWFVPASGEGVPGHEAHLLVDGGTAIALAQLARFEIVVVNGRTLLTIPV
jgi:anti-sigma factor RsiW